MFDFVPLLRLFLLLKYSLLLEHIVREGQLYQKELFRNYFVAIYIQKLACSTRRPMLRVLLPGR